MAERYIRALLLLRVPFFVLLAALAVAAVWRARALETDNSLPVWFEKDDANYLRYVKFVESWGSDEIVLIGFRAPDLFTAERLRWLRELSEKIAGVTNIRKVTSLTNVEHMFGVEGGLVVEPLVGEIVESPEELETLRRRALRNPLLRGYLLSEDGEATAIEARIEKTDIPLKRRMENELREILAAEEKRTGIHLYMTGIPIIDAAFDRYTEEDYARAFPLMIATLILFLWISRPSIAGVLVPIAATTVPMVLTVGLYAASGGTMNMLTSMVFVVLLALTVGDSLHFVSHYQREVALGAAKADALTETLRKLVKPCLFTSLTTAAGFGSFLSSRMAALAEIGVWTAIGVMFAYAMAMTLTPALLSVLPMGRPRLRPRESALIERIGEWPARHARTIVGASVLLAVVSIAGLLRLRAETDNLEYFPADSEIRLGNRFVEENLSGAVPLEVVISGPADFVKDPEILRRIESVENHLESLPEGRKALSVVDLVKEMNVVLHEGDRQFHALPETRTAVGQQLLLYELSGGDEMADFVTTSYDAARVTGFMNSMTSERMREVVEAVNRKLDGAFPDGVETRVEGVASLWAWLDTYLLQSQMRSFGLALVVIGAMMWRNLGSARLAIVSLIPNVLPILMTLGFMGWSGIRLDTGTVLVAAVALGLVVDNTIHYLARFREELERDGDYPSAAHRTLRLTGPPILYSSAVLICGFLVTTSSNFGPMISFGGLTSLTLATGLVADLFLLPTLLILMRPIDAALAPVEADRDRPISRPARLC